jgi:dihydrofolate synthase/folylpolyglutamate synthase
MQAVRQGLMLAEIPGRFQILPGRPAVVLDVAHNPQATAVLSENLSNMGFYSDTWAVCGMFADKDIAGSLGNIASRIDHWLLCDLPGPRASSATALAAVIASVSTELGLSPSVATFPDPASAFNAAQAGAKEGDRIVAFGSFLTVAGVMQAVATKRSP